ncbi:MAG: hypothetical protein C5B55_13930 [Blastocatellia bacterium]|nr:MAG: hypothetical protein C5B55_13930 [Blastocatellia bacterium]
MFLQPYIPHELKFAYCYRLFLRFRTFKIREYACLASLGRADLRKLLDPYSIRLLEFSSDPTDVLTTVSLQPEESISSCASKVKGRVSKWLRDELGFQERMDLLSRGYFACTIGRSRRQQIERYLSLQSEHHGYSNRVLPPVFDMHYELTPSDLERVTANHCSVTAQFHIVLATTLRQGVLGSKEGEAIANVWRKLESE